MARGVPSGIARNSKTRSNDETSIPKYRGADMGRPSARLLALVGAEAQVAERNPSHPGRPGGEDTGRANHGYRKRFDELRGHRVQSGASPDGGPVRTRKE